MIDGADKQAKEYKEEEMAWWWCCEDAGGYTHCLFLYGCF